MPGHSVRINPPEPRVKMLGMTTGWKCQGSKLVCIGVYTGWNIKSSVRLNLCSDFFFCLFYLLLLFILSCFVLFCINLYLFFVFVEPPVTIVRKMEDQRFPDGALISIECELSRHNVDVKWLKVSTWFCWSLLLLRFIPWTNAIVCTLKFHLTCCLHYTSEWGWSKAEQGAAHLRHGPKTLSSAHEVSSPRLWDLHLRRWRRCYIMQRGRLW